VSITGIWGVSFLITWFAAVANWVWEQNANWTQVRGGIGFYAGILTLVLLLGGARLVLFSPQTTTVRVAAVTRSFDLFSHVADCEQGDWDCIHRVTSESLDVYLEDSQQAVLAGAKMIVWQEGAIWLLEEDEAAFVEQGREFARQHDVYLEMGLMVLPPDENPTYRENKAILIDPSGNLIWEYLKSEIVPGDIDTPGDGQVPTLETPYGQIGSVICFDLDWPYLSRQAGGAGVDLMLVPADDWLAIDPIHSHMAAITAVANGFSIIRPTFEGLSIAADYQGRMLAAMDDFTTEEVVMIADVRPYDRCDHDLLTNWRSVCLVVYGRLCGDYWMDHRSAKNRVILSGIYLSIAENAIVKNKSQKMIFQSTQTK
jgi:apolipoprotein N-acyltransferase